MTEEDEQTLLQETRWVRKLLISNASGRLKQKHIASALGVIRRQ